MEPLPLLLLMTGMMTAMMNRMMMGMMIHFNTSDDRDDIGRDNSTRTLITSDQDDALKLHDPLSDT